MGAMVGWSSVATVAAHPAVHVLKAGKPPGAAAIGSAAPAASVIWRVLKGL